VYADNNSGSATAFSASRLGFYSIGESLDLALLDSRVSTLYTAIGAALAPTASNADAQDWINRVHANGGTVSTSTAAAVNTFCNDIDAAGIRDRFFRLNLFCGGDLNAVLVPLYRGQSRTGTQFGNTTDTNNNFVSGDYSETGASGGLVSNGSTKSLATGFAPNNLTATSMHLSAYVVTANSSLQAATAIGQFTLNGAELSLRHREQSSVGNAFYSVFNDANSFVRGPTGNPTGHVIGTNTAQNDKRFYLNGSQSGTTATANSGSTLSANDVYVFAANNNNLADFRSNTRLAAYSIGAGLTASQASSYYTALQAFQTALSRNV
jgi:hypothetical protein